MARTSNTVLNKSGENGHPLYSLIIAPVAALFSEALRSPSMSADPTAYGGSQARGLIGAMATGLRHSHSNAGSLTH